jgi:hypothetical protein
MAWYKPETGRYWNQSEAACRGSMLRHLNKNGYKFKVAKISFLINRSTSSSVYLQPWIRYKKDFKFKPSYPQPYRNHKEWNYFWLSYTWKFIPRIK